MTSPSLASHALKVEGVLWGGPRPKAVINGEVYGVRDVINGGKILSIGSRGVLIDYDGTLVSYSLSSPSVMPQTAEGARPQQGH